MHFPKRDACTELTCRSFRHHRHSAADFRHQRHFGVICWLIAVICCHLLSCHRRARGHYEYSCSALTRARVLLLPRMPQGRAEGVAGLDLGLQVPLRSATSTANIVSRLVRPSDSRRRRRQKKKKKKEQERQRFRPRRRRRAAAHGRARRLAPLRVIGGGTTIRTEKTEKSGLATGLPLRLDSGWCPILGEAVGEHLQAGVLSIE